MEMLIGHSVSNFGGSSIHRVLVISLASISRKNGKFGSNSMLSPLGCNEPMRSIRTWKAGSTLLAGDSMHCPSLGLEAVQPQLARGGGAGGAARAAAAAGGPPAPGPRARRH